MLHRLKQRFAPSPPPSEQIDAHLKRLFALLDINCVLDIGANQGQYGRSLRANGYAGHIVSFEPSPADYAILAQHAAADPLWQVHAVALGREDGTLDFNITSDSLFNSALRPNDFITQQGVTIQQTVTVPQKRLDSILKRIIDPIATPRLYLKTDTQGFDLHVLAGAVQSLPRILAMQAELSVKPIYDGAPSYLESIAALTTYGYEITGLFPIARDNMLRVVEYDCVLIQAAAAGESTGLFPP